MGVRRTSGRFGFDHEQLALNVARKKKEEALSWPQVATQTGVAYSHLVHYFAENPRVPRTRNRVMTIELAIRLMMWIGDYDIRDYLVEKQ